MEAENFDENAAFDQAVNEIESGGQTAEAQPSVAEETKQNTSDQRDGETEQQAAEPENALPEWLANATDEVKENFLRLQAENKQLAHRERSQRGRVGALTKKWQQAQAALEQAKQSQGSYDQELATLREDYPEIADLLGRIVAGQGQHLQAISDPIAQIAEANVQENTVAEMDYAIDYVNQIIPNAMQIAQDPQFHAWVQKQPSGVQALFRSNDPNDAVYLLSEYQKTVSARKEQTTKREQKLAAMTLPHGNSNPKGGEEVDVDALFDQLAAQADKTLQQ